MSDENQKVFNTGWTMTRAIKPINGRSGGIVICCPSFSEDGAYEPAQSISIHRENDLLELLDAINFALGK